MTKEKWEGGLKFIEDIFCLHEISGASGPLVKWYKYETEELIKDYPWEIHLTTIDENAFLSIYKATFEDNGSKGVLTSFYKKILECNIKKPYFTIHRWTLHEAAIATAHIINDKDNCQHCTADFLDYTK